MDFDFTDEQKAFVVEVERFLDENHDPEVMDPSRENMAQLVDTPKRRAFMKKIGERGWLGMTWPKEYGGSEADGIYEFLLNECLARRRRAADRQGRRHHRQDADPPRQREAQARVPAEDPHATTIEFAIGYSEPQAGSDAAAMQLKATREGDGWRLNGQKIFTTSAHFARVVLGRGAHRLRRGPSTTASPCSCSRWIPRD